MSESDVVDPPATIHPHVPPTKVCPRCSVQSATDGAFCPHCGASFEQSAPPTRRRMLLIAIACVVVIAAVAVGLVLKMQSDREAEASRAADAQATVLAEALASAEAQAEEEAAAAAEQAADEAAAAARAQEEADERERAARALIVASLEASIQEDAEGRVAEGVLDGPILRTSCTPIGGGSADDLTAITGNFECIAVNEERADGSASGYRFTATIEWGASSYQWRLGG